MPEPFSGGRACLRRLLLGGLATIGICWTGEGLKRSSRPKRSGWHSPPTKGASNFLGCVFILGSGSLEGRAQPGLPHLFCSPLWEAAELEGRA